MYALLAGGRETAKNGLISFGRSIYTIVALNEGAQLIASLTGNPHYYTLHAALQFLCNHGDAIAAFASSDIQLQEWLAWIIASARAIIVQLETSH